MDVCLRSPESTNDSKCVPEKAHCCVLLLLLLLQQCELLIVDMCNVELQHLKAFNFDDGTEGE